MVLQGLIIGLRIGTAYAIGSFLGGKLAAAIPGAAASDPARIGIKIGTGVVGYAALGLFL